MLHYPKIPGSRNAPDGRCIAFEKYDGTNLHWDWDRDFGWHAFGTRRDEFNLTEAGVAQFVRRHAHLRESVAVIWGTLAEGIGGRNTGSREAQCEAWLCEANRDRDGMADMQRPEGDGLETATPGQPA